MNRLYRFLYLIVRSPRNEWIRAHYAELRHVSGRWRRLRWTLGVLPVTVTALASQLRHDASEFRGGVLTRAIVVILSSINLAAAVGLLVVYMTDSGHPLLLLAFIGGLAVQALYSMVILKGGFGGRPNAARVLQLVGSASALVVGAFGFILGVAANIDPINADPEYGPMTIALLFAMHGLASLLAFTPREPGAAESWPPQ